MTPRLERRVDDAVIGGVCAGLGAHLHVDPVLVRIVFVLLAIAGGAGVLLYALCWVIIPEAPGGTIAGTRDDSTTGSRPVLGLILIAVGGLLLLERLLPFDVSDLLRFWPLLLVATGAWILLKPLHDRSMR